MLPRFKKVVQLGTTSQTEGVQLKFIKEWRSGEFIILSKKVPCSLGEVKKIKNTLYQIRTTNKIELIVSHAHHLKRVELMIAGAVEALGKAIKD